MIAAVLRPMLRKGVVWRRLDDGYVLYDPVTDETALLNLSAAAVLEFCDGTRAVNDIAEEIARVFGVDEIAAAAEIHDVLEALRSRGFM